MNEYDNYFLLLAVGAVAVGTYVAIRWLSGKSESPNPWDREIDEKLELPDTQLICHRCLTPQNGLDWFCPHCGSAVGPYNNWMPYVYIFSQGEVLRAGTQDPIKPSFLTIAGYFFISLVMYNLFAPVYWFFFIKNLIRSHDCAVNT